MKSTPPFGLVATNMWRRWQDRKTLIESWYKFVPPRKEVHEGQSLNPNEFAIVLSTLNPRDSQKKRLLDAMLLACRGDSTAHRGNA